MGDIADDIIDGIYCQHCGDYLGAPTGYPRSCNSCNKPRKKNSHNHQQPKYVRSISDMLKAKGIRAEEANEVIDTFLMLKDLSTDCSFDDKYKTIHSSLKQQFSDFVNSITFLSKLTNKKIEFLLESFIN